MVDPGVDTLPRRRTLAHVACMLPCTYTSSTRLSWPRASARIVVGGERKGRCRADFDWITWLQIEASLSSGNFCGGDFARCAASALSLYGHASSFLCYYPLLGC